MFSVCGKKMLQHFPDSMLQSGILVKLVDLFELGMEDAAPQNLLKLMTQLDMLIQII